MHVALFTYGFPEKPDGSYTPAVIDHFVTLARHCRITVFAIGANRPGLRSVYNFEGPEVVATGPLSPFNSLPNLIWLWVQLARRHAAEPFDILHGIWHVGSLAATLAGKALRRPTIVSMMGGEIIDIPEINYGVIRSARWRTLMRFVFRNATKITAGSTYYLEKIRSFHSGVSGKFCLMPLGTCWTEDSSNRVRTSKGVRILIISAMQPVKNLAALLDHIPSISRPDIQWFIAGDGPERTAIERIIAEKKLHDTVTLLGWQKPADFRRTLTSYDFLVSCSFHEAQGMGVIESAGTGLPILTTMVGVADELRRAGAEIVELGSVSDLEGAVLTTIKSLGHHKDRAILASHKIRKIYDISSVIEMTMKLYSGTLCDFEEAKATNWYNGRMPVWIAAMRLLRPTVMRIAVPVIMHLRKRNADTRVCDLKLHTRLEVFHPRFFFSGPILASFLDEFNLSGKKVLDMGSGSGIVGIVAARKGAEVFAVDINPQAVELTRRNAELNGVGSRLCCLESNLFRTMDGLKFDFILFNPPYYPGTPRSAEQAAWLAGENHGVLDEFLAEAHAHLNAGGRIVLIVSSDMDLRMLHDRVTSSDYRVVSHKRRNHFFEVFHLLTLRYGTPRTTETRPAAVETVAPWPEH
jgi:release factor glutamine methyltransferase